MTIYSEKFMRTQVGRSVAIHHEPPDGERRKSTIQNGYLMDVKDRMLVVRVANQEHPVHVDMDADQPAFARRDRSGGWSVWWSWESPQKPLPPGFADE